jgi:hypothetical protein
MGAFDLPQRADSFCDIIGTFCFAWSDWQIADRRIYFVKYLGRAAPQEQDTRELHSPEHQKRAGKRFQFAQSSRPDAQIILRPKARGDHHR